MTGHGFQVRLGIRIAAIALAGVLAAVQTGSAGSPATTTYSFIGTCTDCTGNGVATLVLQNYTLGSQLSNSNLVSFSYNSNLTSFTVTPGTGAYLTGSLPASLPAPALVVASTTTSSFIGFISNANGNWCAGPQCEYDSGTNGVWSVGTAAPPATVPVLGTPALVGMALILALMGWILLRRVPKAAAC